MKNTAFTYENRESTLGESREVFRTKDYFSQYYGGIDELVKANFNFFEYVNIDNNNRLEIISYDRYGSENYADLIVMINQANFLWMIPYDSDIQISIGDAYSSYLTLELNSAKDADKDVFIQNYGVERSQNENSQKRKIIVPKTQNIQDVVGLIDNFRNTYKDTE